MVEKIRALKGQEVVVLGHINADVDSYCSMLLMKEILYFIGAEPILVVPDKVDEESADIMSKIGIDVTGLQGTVPANANLFLVDHHETTMNGKIVGCIDHHPTAKTFDYPIYLNEPASSCSMHLYRLMLSLKMTITVDIAKLVVLSAHVDTCSMRSSKTVESEIPVVKELIRDFHLDGDHYERLGLCLTDFSKPKEVVMMNGRKDYVYNGYKVSSSYIQIYGEMGPSAEDIVDCIVRLYRYAGAHDIDRWVFIVVNFEDNETYVYHLESGKQISEEVLPGIQSRGSVIMPKVEAIFLEMEPKTNN